MNVKLRTKVTDSVQLSDGRKQLTLSTGEKLTTDMYVPTFGLIPNSSYIPASYLNANGSVMVDEFLRVKGAKDVWAIGDVSDVESWQFITCDRQSTHLARNMISMMNNKPPLPYKVAASRMTILLAANLEFWLISLQVSWASRLVRRPQPATSGVSRFQVSSSSGHGRHCSSRIWGLRLMAACFDSSDALVPIQWIQSQVSYPAITSDVGIWSIRSVHTLNLQSASICDQVCYRLGWSVGRVSINLRIFTAQP